MGIESRGAYKIRRDPSLSQHRDKSSIRLIKSVQGTRAGYVDPGMAEEGLSKRQRIRADLRFSLSILQLPSSSWPLVVDYLHTSNTRKSAWHGSASLNRQKAWASRKLEGHFSSWIRTGIPSVATKCSVAIHWYAVASNSHSLS